MTIRKSAIFLGLGVGAIIADRISSTPVSQVIIPVLLATSLILFIFEEQPVNVLQKNLDAVIDSMAQNEAEFAQLRSEFENTKQAFATYKQVVAETKADRDMAIQERDAAVKNLEEFREAYEKVVASHAERCEKIKELENKLEIAKSSEKGFTSMIHDKDQRIASLGTDLRCLVTNVSDSIRRHGERDQQASPEIRHSFGLTGEW